ncbi:ribonuclease P protein component [Diaminobutyricimonas aerilata]|uniref:Ribonuclease P protein component n=1 Tax=Diaminobutyricimonas aerilata TaxID=1162967 RepID=A0A2M9CP85_9MICO|nr:ribonuclease P protein component [Diaminobutyricimonas aerilata]PJJ73715.1 ribonuclease P protein component [Diaminobutyricimonas aerilata]
MLPRGNRINRGDEFRAVMRRGRRVASDRIVVHARQLDDGPARMGFVVGKMVGNAVTRNRVRRRLRELGRHALPALPEHTGVVVRALPPSAEASWTQLSEDFASLLQRSGAAS